MIGYFENDCWSTGNYIDIEKYGKFHVGERYFKDGVKWRRGTLYSANGNELKFD